MIQVLPTASQINHGYICIVQYSTAHWASNWTLLMLLCATWNVLLIQLLMYYFIVQYNKNATMIIKGWWQGYWIKFSGKCAVFGAPKFRELMHLNSVLEYSVLSIYFILITQNRTVQKADKTVGLWFCWPFKAHQCDPDSREKDESNAVRSYIESSTALHNPFSEAGSQTLEPLINSEKCSFDGLLCVGLLCGCMHEEVWVPDRIWLKSGLVFMSATLCLSAFEWLYTFELSEIRYVLSSDMD